jgi:hypothetical protein
LRYRGHNYRQRNDDPELLGARLPQLARQIGAGELRLQRTRMVREFGMSAALGPVGCASASPMYLGTEEVRSRPYAEATQRVVDEEVAELLRSTVPGRRAPPGATTPGRSPRCWRSGVVGDLAAGAGYHLGHRGRGQRRHRRAGAARVGRLGAGGRNRVPPLAIACSFGLWLVMAPTLWEFGDGVDSDPGLVILLLAGSALLAIRRRRGWSAPTTGDGARRPVGTGSEQR